MSAHADHLMLSTVDENLLTTPESSPRKVRRQTAIYPNVNSTNKQQKPFSRSAAKRESVMALGSIEHLQHYFTKTGIGAEKETLFKQSKAFVPALGGPSSTRSPLLSIQESDLPPSPAVPAPSTPQIPPFILLEKAYEADPEHLKPGVIQDLRAVARAWVLPQPLSNAAPSTLTTPSGNHLPPASGHFEVLSTLKLTTRAIRSVRAYLVSLPDDSTLASRPDQTRFTPQMFAPPSAQKRRVSATPPDDPLGLIRRSALEVLSVLRILEEYARLPLSDEAYDARSEVDHISEPSHAGSFDDGVSEGGDTSFSGYSVISLPVPGRSEGVPVWIEDQDEFGSGFEEEDEKQDPWDERLVLGGGWLYRTDIDLEELSDEREVVGRYLDCVDGILFDGSATTRGWERVQHRAPSESFPLSQSPVEAMMGAPFELEAVEDSNLPDWAKRSMLQNNPVARAHALLSSLLPKNLACFLPEETNDILPLVDSLSSGQLLCVAYNVGVRRSRKPWGYIHRESIHDIIALEQHLEGDEAEKRRKGWTFRRTDNLRLWAGALKLRYMIPVTTSQPRVKPKYAFPASEKPIVIDLKSIARKEDGWVSMLEELLMRWVDLVILEMRGER